MEKINSAAPQKAPFNSEVDDVLHPEQAFEHPQHVVEAPDLTLEARHPRFMGREGASQKRLVTALTDEALTQIRPRRRWCKWPLEAAFPALQKIKIGSKASAIVIGPLANNPKH